MPKGQTGPHPQDFEFAFAQPLEYKIKDNIQNAPKNKKYGEILKGLLELRQSCLWQNHTGKATKNMRNLTSTKVDYLLESLEQIQEEQDQKESHKNILKLLFKKSNKNLSEKPF